MAGYSEEISAQKKEEKMGTPLSQRSLIGLYRPEW